MRSSSVVLGLSLFVGCIVGPLRLASADHRHCSIAEARHEEVGATVSIEGTVTVSSGTFDGGFALQQGEAGLYVLDSGTSAELEIGDKVRVTGVLVNSSGLLAVQPSSVSRLGSGRLISPERARTGQVGERTEGRLLKLDGDMRGALVDDSPYGFKLEIDNGSGPIQVFLYPGANISTAGLKEGVHISVVCFSSQYETHYECDPRMPSDLRVHR